MNSNNTGIIFDIQRFSVHDGPGIRTTVFMKGCPMRCKWCHNPEGLSEKFKLRYMEKLCIGCGACGSACPQGVHGFYEKKHTIDRAGCTLCGKCIEACPAGALSVCGYEISPDELIKKINADADFYEKDGGVTFSGGEALMQADFIAEVSKRLKEENAVPSVVIDTSGYVPWVNIEKTIPWCDLYLYDIKAFDENRHINGTGVSNKIILENLIKLDDTGAKIWIRIPVIDGINADLQEMRRICDFIGHLKNVLKVTLMPYNTLGIDKYKTLGIEYPDNPLKTISSEDMLAYKQIFNCFNII